MSASDFPIEPPEVADRVEEYISSELSDAEKYGNRSPLDESGIWSLHRLAATIYALGWRQGFGVGERNAQRGGQRREAEHRAQLAAALAEEKP